MNPNVKPVLKWAGGKRQLLGAIKSMLPSSFECYYEPFIGGGAVLFELQPKKAVLNDLNHELINVYKMIKNCPDELIQELKKHKNTPVHYYKVREMDRKRTFKKKDNVIKAARFIYLNRTCFNGLHRVNSAGFFNVPYGKYKNPNIVNETSILAISAYLNKESIYIYNGNFETALETARAGDFVYLDPPYVPASTSANFTSYVKESFGDPEQVRLRDVCRNLDRKGVKWLLSNSAVGRVKELYQDFDITIVQASRAINSNKDKRGKIDEVLICNY